MPKTTRLFTSLTLALCLVATLLTVGCASRDRHVYRSTALAPKVVSVVSVETGEVLWSMNVPAGQQLMLDFDRGNKGGEQYSSASIPADSMKWELWSLDARASYGSKRKGGKKLQGDKIKLPGDFVMIKVELLNDGSTASAR